MRPNDSSKSSEGSERDAAHPKVISSRLKLVDRALYNYFGTIGVLGESPGEILRKSFWRPKARRKANCLSLSHEELARERQPLHRKGPTTHLRTIDPRSVLLSERAIRELRQLFNCPRSRWIGDAATVDPTPYQNRSTHGVALALPVLASAFLTHE